MEIYEIGTKSGHGILSSEFSWYLFINLFNILWQKQLAPLTCHKIEHKITVYAGTLNVTTLL